ncbi:hypothetical protein MESS2_10004 [Mesorhizobium metallidurans STM 2683]|uniref:Transposase n=1 Tax=Mesorhizobium metallidurans STM 2683 TaxID=1297569 RepID=M5EFG8_9HYPH|nr:hypothetical protein MESS2_10004 [Mesorhizobium metallidurans STM 2683]
MGNAVATARQEGRELTRPAADKVPTPIEIVTAGWAQIRHRAGGPIHGDQEFAGLDFAARCGAKESSNMQPLRPGYSAERRLPRSRRRP